MGACGVGDEGTPAETDDRDEKLGIVCNAMFSITGTFTAGTPARPSDTPTGCWPVGTWTFTANMRENECEAPPMQLATSYSFRVDRKIYNPDPPGSPGYDPTLDLGWDETYTYLGDMSKLYRVSVSEGGSGECEGNVQLYSADGTEYWNLKPGQRGAVIEGFAEYAKYETNQR
ncbi:MAG: hypothetical protein JWP01_3899 [Myxococcales bacterium]|nr:hypothetical protein [Myxococcales bacterium]